MSAISVAVFFEDEVDHMPASDLSAVLHTGGCQDPTATTLTCDIAVAGRVRTYSSTPPDMPNGDCDSGDQPVLPLSAGLYNGREYYTAYYEWPVHISHAAAGQGMSLILLNRTDPGGNPNAAPEYGCSWPSSPAPFKNHFRAAGVFRPLVLTAGPCPILRPQPPGLRRPVPGPDPRRDDWLHGL